MRVHRKDNARLGFNGAAGDDDDMRPRFHGGAADDDDPPCWPSDAMRARYFHKRCQAILAVRSNTLIQSIEEAILYDPLRYPTERQVWWIDHYYRLYVQASTPRGAWAPCRPALMSAIDERLEALEGGG